MNSLQHQVDQMSTDHQLGDIVVAKLTHGCQLATAHFGKRFAVPLVRYNDLGTIAGFAIYPTWEIVLNSNYLSAHTEQFIERTVPHELAHLISCDVFGRDAAHHGEDWKYVCHVLGMSDLSPRHKYSKPPT